MARLRAYCRETLADLETPVSAYLKLCGGETPSFLFESNEDPTASGRYSVAAWDPLARLWLTPGQAHARLGERAVTRPFGEFLALARETAAELACEGLPPLPFVGGLVGFLGFDCVRLLERLATPRPQEPPLAELYLPARHAVFDHHARRLTMVALAPEAATGEAMLDRMAARLAAPLVPPPARGGRFALTPPDRKAFLAAVERAKAYIEAGDIFQVVLSGEFRGPSALDPFAVYRWLRVKSPSPYLFFLDLPGRRLAGASPETLVRLAGDRLTLRPIAGTRGRGADPAADQALERELLASEKERAEHVMLVDLARNDAGRVAQYGSVTVAPYLQVERFSHVMHLTSQVNARLAPGQGPWEALAAAFPAGTVSGAPKVRALQIIDELEGTPRGAYAGAVGAFGPGSSLDVCIAIRMLEFRPGEALLRVGAGIVADSDPAMEYQELMHKAAQGIAALGLAAEG